MNWPLLLLRLLGAARVPLQAAVLAYVGAGGLAGIAVVGGLLATPAHEVVQEALAPAGRLVEEQILQQPLGNVLGPRPAPPVATAGGPLAVVAPPLTVAVEPDVTSEPDAPVFTPPTPTPVASLPPAQAPVLVQSQPASPSPTVRSEPPSPSPVVPSATPAVPVVVPERIASPSPVQRTQPG
ncbi:MAG TPA: hypothetical protein VFA49_04450, partial [Chloroflexota bacterium]|nr:hypothetical protein [Chloroflexota bacterium]